MAKKKLILRDDFFPVKQIGGKQLAGRCAAEGQPIHNGVYSAFRLSGLTVSGGLAAGGNLPAATLRTLYIKSLIISTTEPTIVKLFFGGWINSQTTAGIGAASNSGRLIINDSLQINTDALLNKNSIFPEIRIDGVISQDPEINIAQASFGSTRLKTSKVAALAGADGLFSYVVTITNSSGGATSGTITVLETLPPGLRYVSGSGSGWSFSESNGVLTATTADIIANNGTKTFTVSVDTKRQVKITLSAIAYAVDIDVAVDAPAIWWCGTSITAGSGISHYRDAYTYLVRNYIRDVRGIPNRVINRAQSASTSGVHEDLRANANFYEPVEPPLATFYEHGVNDASLNVPSATTVVNLQAYVAHWRRIDNKMPIIIISPYPVLDPTLEAKLVILRPILKAAVTALRVTDPNVHFIEATGTMFNPVTQSGTYLSGDGLHPNAAGNALIATTIQAYIAATANLF